MNWGFSRMRTVFSYTLMVWIAGCSPAKPASSSHNPTNKAMSSEIASSPASTSVADESTLARLADATGASGIQFTYRTGKEAGNYAILESLGGGIAIVDYDMDGQKDICVPGGGTYAPSHQIRGMPTGLYRNIGDCRFARVADHSQIDQAPFYTHGAASADFDNDGFPDLLITGYGGMLLFHNQGDGVFTEAAAERGLTNHEWSSSAGWGDLNGDGNLDLYVAHYVNWSFENHPFCPGPAPKDRDVCPPRMFQAITDVCYFGNGDGTFRDVTQEVGLVPGGKGLGVLLADFNLDGHLDVYVANDTEINFLYRNRGDGTLEDISLTSGAGLSDAGMPDGSMGVDVADYNADGLPDIWVANFERESFALYRNEGNLNFQHVSQMTGVTVAGGLFVGWGTAFLDVDLDGDEDIFVSNGHVIRYPTNAPLRQTPLLFENRDGRFFNVARSMGGYMTEPHMGRGIAIGDLNDDQKPDVVISHADEPVTVLRNESLGGNRSLVVRLVGTVSNRDAVGAFVEVKTATGRQSKQVKGGGSYASTSDRPLIFGVGHEAVVQEVAIRWPSGTKQTLSNVAAGATIFAIEGIGITTAGPTRDQSSR